MVVAQQSWPTWQSLIVWHMAFPVAQPKEQAVCTPEPEGRQHEAPEPQSSGPSQTTWSSPAQAAEAMHPVATSAVMLPQQISPAPHTPLPHKTPAWSPPASLVPPSSLGQHNMLLQV